MSHRAASDDLMALARVLPQDRDATLLRATTGLYVQEPPHDRDAMHRYEELAQGFGMLFQGIIASCKSIHAMACRAIRRAHNTGKLPLMIILVASSTGIMR